MTLKVKKDGAWKEASSLKVKINGEWKDVSTLYSKKDGAWVTVYSSGALITFTNYPYPIPVAKGWKYSTDKTNWTTVTSDSKINESGTFTGWVKVKSELSLNDYFTDGQEAQYGVRMDGTPMSYRRYGATSFSNGGRGYVCGGYGYNESSSGDFLSSVDVYDSSGNRTSGTALSAARQGASAFVIGSKGYVCGGYSYISSKKYHTNVDVYDSSGVRTRGSPLYTGAYRPATFTIQDVGFVYGGGNAGSGSPYMNRYDSSGNMTNHNLSTGHSGMTASSNGNLGFVCGGQTHGNTIDGVLIFNVSGVQTGGARMSVYRKNLTSFSNNGHCYVCGGYYQYSVADSEGDIAETYTYFQSTVDIFDTSGNRTSGTSLSLGRSNLTSFVNQERGYVCGGLYSKEAHCSSTVDIYDKYGNRTIGEELSASRELLTSFSNAGRGYVCGGQNQRGPDSVCKYNVDIYYDIPASYSAKIPITAGSTYTLNGTTSTATKSQILSFDEKVSGTITYKTGTVPSS